jgi:hypothetical protein
MDIAIDPLTGDMMLGSTGDAVTLTGRDAIAQHVRVRLAFVLGEWHLDQREGVPYFEQIWIVGADLAVVEEIFRTTIRTTPGIASVRTLKLEHDRQTREIRITECEAVTTDGESIGPDDFVPFTAFANTTTSG